MTKPLIRRMQRLLFAPASEWAVIDSEPADIRAIYMGYVLPLAGFYAACAFIGWLLFGIGLLSEAPPLLTLIGDAIVTVVIHLAMVLVFALVIDALAPSFGARKNFGQAFKLAAYSPTATWAGGVFLIFPLLAPVSFLASLYSLYLLFVGLPRLMRPSSGQAIPYIAIAIICAIGLFLVVSWLLIALRFM